MQEKETEFTPITTRAELDAAIGERLKQERETVAKKYADYDGLKRKNADYAAQIGALTREAAETAKKNSEYERQIGELQSKVGRYEADSMKTRIAHETGLPYELAARLSGESEDDIRKDAAALVKLLDSRKPPQPMRDAEPAAGTGDPKRAAIRALSARLANET